MSGKGAKQRRIEKRRNEKRDGLTENEQRIYKKRLRAGYSHTNAMIAARAK